MPIILNLDGGHGWLIFQMLKLPSVRICFVGESFVNGTGDPECLGWAGRICVNANKNGYDITYYNLGVRRETSAELKNRWHREVSYRLPKEYDGRVVFCFGVNDTTLENGKTRINFADSIENTRAILSEAKQLYPVLMISPAPVIDEEQNHRVSDLSKQFALVCSEINVPYLDVFSKLKKSNIWLNEAQAAESGGVFREGVSPSHPQLFKRNDGAHPRTAGYKEFAEIVQNWEAWLNWFK